MPTLDLDPRDYATAGDSALSRERAVQRVARSASGALSGGYNMAGSDDGGERFAQAYDTAARGIFDAVDDAAEGARTLGRALIVAGALHSAAERGARGETGAGAGFTDPGAASAASTPPPPTSSGGNPMPVPGLEIVIDFLGGLLWPDADTDRLRTAADAWSQLSRDLTAEATELRRVAADLSGITSGEKSAFDDRIQELADRLDEIAAAVGDGGDGIATQCTSYAEQVDDTREQSLIMLRDLAIEIAATVAVSAALSLVTFGAAAAVGAGTTVARAAWYGARIATLINRLRAVAMTVATKLDDLVRSVRALQRWRAWQATGSLGSKVTFNAVTDGVGVFGASFLTSDDTNPFVAGATAMGGGAFANVLTSGRYLDNFAGRVFGGQISAATEYGAITALEGEDFNLTDLFVSVGLGTVGAGVTSVFGGKTRTSRDITSGQHQAELGAGGLSTGTQPGANTAPGSPGSPAASVTTDGPSGPRPDFDGPQTGASDPGSAAGADAPVHIESGDAPTVGASDAAPAAPTGGGTPVPQGEAPTATGGDAGPAAPQGSAPDVSAGDAPVTTPETPSAPVGNTTTPDQSAPPPPVNDAPAPEPLPSSTPADTTSPDFGEAPAVDGSQTLPGTPSDGPSQQPGDGGPDATAPDADVPAPGDGDVPLDAPDASPDQAADSAQGEGDASAPASTVDAGDALLTTPTSAGDGPYSDAPVLTTGDVTAANGTQVDLNQLTTTDRAIPQAIDMEAQVDDSTLFGVGADGSPNDFKAFQDNHMLRDEDGQLVRYDWPNDAGQVPGSTRRATVEDYKTVFGGDVFTRAGDPDGGFAAPIDHGNYYSFSQSTLTPDTLFKEFHHYRFTADADAQLEATGLTMVVEQVAPGLGRPGGGMQMRWIKPNGRRATIEELIDLGAIEEVFLK